MQIKKLGENGEDLSISCFCYCPIVEAGEIKEKQNEMKTPIQASQQFFDSDRAITTVSGFNFLLSLAQSRYQNIYQEEDFPTNSSLCLGFFPFCFDGAGLVKVITVIIFLIYDANIWAHSKTTMLSTGKPARVLIVMSP